MFDDILQRLSEYKAWIGIAVLFLLVGGLSLWWWQVSDSPSSVSNPDFHANQERIPAASSRDTTNHATMMMFTADWCPHCKAAKPEWEAFKEEVNGHTINGFVVDVREVNCTQSTAEVQAMCDKYAIEGFPTVKLDKGGGDVVSYDAKPTSALLSEFLHTML